jgi:hypothetical protein
MYGDQSTVNVMNYTYNKSDIVKLMKIGRLR